MTDHHRRVRARGSKAGLMLAEGAGLALGERSRGTPRTALHLLAQAADYAVVTEEPEITPDVVLDSLALHGIDRLGLTRDDRRFLDALCIDHMGRPVGLANLANSTGVDMPTVLGMIEPFLLRAGLIKRGSRGRMATPAAYTHLGLKAPVTLTEPPRV
jgi:Holliday junction DNA helicase RuvB